MRWVAPRRWAFGSLAAALMLSLPAYSQGPAVAKGKLSITGTPAPVIVYVGPAVLKESVSNPEYGFNMHELLVGRPMRRAKRP